MTEAPLQRKPRFRVGERVRIVGPSVREGKENTGEVIELISSSENAILRYRVRFSDDSSESFFGFELESAE
jgi:hypothetical protein